jgi:23S rRNA pseudouridine2605 synthase
MARKQFSKKRFLIKNQDKTTRLNKYIANSGICSRREADRFIEAGVVSVNGIGITKMGYKVLPTDVVKFNGRKIKISPYKYIVLNKPKNYTLNINEKKKNVLDEFIKDMYKNGLTPVDKLNKMEMGVLIFTNDLDLSRKISNKKHRIKSIYQITLNKKLTQIDLKKIANGIKVNNTTKNIDAISYIKGKEKNEIGLENSTGGIKTIRELFTALSYSIIKIDRVFYAGISKKDLPRKKYRELAEAEINILKRL